MIRAHTPTQRFAVNPDNYLAKIDLGFGKYCYVFDDNYVVNLDRYFCSGIITIWGEECHNASIYVDRVHRTIKIYDHTENMVDGRIIYTKTTPYIINPENDAAVLDICTCDIQGNQTPRLVLEHCVGGDWLPIDA